MNTTTPEDIAALALVEGAGRKAVHGALRLARRNSRPLGSLFGAPLPELLKMVAPGEETATDALSRCGEQEQFRGRWLMEAARDHGVSICTPEASSYPGLLFDALNDQAPVLIFFLGNEALLQNQGAAIVGTRHPTNEGAALATAAAQAFAAEGVPVVSGGASGIDLAAHKGALQAGGCTLVILPEGLCSYDPPTFLRAGLERGQVVLLSEFMPTDGWLTRHAMTRNRTIAAYARVTCVIEPREKGGSMFTAEQTLAQHRPVFCWGGACRDGALRGQANAFSLTDARGHLQTDALLRTVQRVDSDAPVQIGLFD